MTRRGDGVVGGVMVVGVSVVEHNVSRLPPHRVFQRHQVSLEVLVVREVQGDHHGHLSHGRPSQKGRGGSGCGQQWCELQGGSVSQWGEQDCGVCVSVSAAVLTVPPH